MNADVDKNKDIPFSSLYQQLLTMNDGENLISLLLHADGIGLTRSTKLKMWMFSGSLIELPPKLRNRHCNMVLISIWVAYVEPVPQLWLKRSIAQLEMIKFQGKKRFHQTLSFVRASTLPVRIWWGSRRGRVDVSLLFYAFIMTISGIRAMKKNFKLVLFGITGDCPALSLMGNFINHNGYYSCWLCFIRGQRMNNKQQYHHEVITLRTISQYARLSERAERTKKNVLGHFGTSVIASILDVPFPHAIVLDYLHISLLGHVKAIALSIYDQLRPAQRKQLNGHLRDQSFPRKSSRSSVSHQEEFQAYPSFEFRFLQSKDQANG